MLASKKLKLEVSFLNEDFSTNKTLVFANLPIQVKCTIIGLPSGNKAVVTVYGVSGEHANMITTLKLKQGEIPKRKVRLFADNGGGAYQLVYEGYIICAIPVYNAPKVAIQIESSVGAFPNAKTISSNSFEPNTPAFQVFRKICNDYGFECEEEVTGTVQSTKPKTMEYAQDGLFARLHQAELDYDCSCVYKNGKFYLYPNKKTVMRKHYLSPKNYIEYPSFSDTGIIIKTGDIFNINLHQVISIGGSEVLYANGTWAVWKIEYNLQSFMPNGKWEMTLYGVRWIDDTGS